MENNNNFENKLFFSYIVHPKIKFETYEEGEKILLLLRAHPFTQIGWMINTLIFIVIIFSLNFILPQFVSSEKIFIFNCFSLVFIFSFVWMNFLNWYFNVYKK